MTPPNISAGTMPIQPVSGIVHPAHGVVIPPRRKSTLPFSRLSLAYIIVLFGFLFWNGYGQWAGIAYGTKLFFTLALTSPVILVGWRRPLLALELVVMSLFPIKSLIDHQFISSSTYHLLTVLCTVFLLRYRPINAIKVGRTIIIALFYFCMFQSLRAFSLVSVLKNLLNMMDFFLMVYIIMPRINDIFSRRLLRTYSVGVFITICIILATHDWTLASRLGNEMLMNSNNVGITAGIAIIIRVFLQSDQRVNTFSPILYTIMCGCVFLTGSRGALLITVMGVMLLLFRNNKTYFVAMLLAGIFGIAFLAGNKTLTENAAAEHIAKGIGTEVEMEDVSSIRMMLIRRGMDMLAGNPIIGVGFSNFAEIAQVLSPSTGRPLPAHNIYLSMLVETGPIGFLLLMAWIFRFTFRQKQNLLSISLTGSTLIIGATHGNFLDFWYAVPLGLSLAISGGDWRSIFNFRGGSAAAPQKAPQGQSRPAIAHPG